MTRRQRTDLPPDAPASEQLDELENSKTLDAATAARDFLEQFEGVQGVRIPTYRQNAENGRWEYVRTLTPDIANEEYVQKTFGAGIYKFVARGPKSERYPSGHYGQHTVAVADAIPKDAAPAHVPDSGTDALKMVLAMTMQHSAMLEKMLFTMLGSKEESKGADPTKMLEIATGIAAKMHEGQQPFNPKELLGNFLEWYDRGFERGIDSGPKEEGYMGVVRDIGKPLVEMLSRIPASPVHAPVDAPAAHAQLPPAQEVHQVKGPLWLNAVAPYFPVLLNLAVLGSSPDIVADMVTDKLPDDVLDKIRGDAIAPNWEEQVADVLPEQFKVRYRPWTLQVLHEIKESLTAPPDAPIVGGGEDDEGE